MKGREFFLGYYTAILVICLILLAYHYATAPAKEKPEGVTVPEKGFMLLKVKRVPIEGKEKSKEEAESK